MKKSIPIALALLVAATVWLNAGIGAAVKSPPCGSLTPATLSVPSAPVVATRGQQYAFSVGCTYADGSSMQASISEPQDPNWNAAIGLYHGIAPTQTDGAQAISGMSRTFACGDKAATVQIIYVP